MANRPNRNDYKLTPITLRYRDPAFEADYLERVPKAMAKTLKPVLMVVLPLILMFALIEATGAVRMPVDWQTNLAVAVMLGGLLLLGTFAPRFIELGIIGVFFVGLLLMLRFVDDDASLQRMMPGFVMLVMLANFVGVRFLQGLFCALSLMLIVTTFVLWRGLDPGILIDSVAFLSLGLVATVSMSYTVDRQRRLLFAKVNQLADERDSHEKMALHDPLTDLPNRALLRERMRQSLARAKRHHGQFAVLFVDLDDFKSVNDRYGHGVGDDVLCALAGNLLQNVRDEDTVARIGGDEFVVLSDHVRDDASAKIAADRIQAAVSTPVVVNSPRADKIHIQVTCSIGIALCPRDGDALDELIDRADAAMYGAKRAGKDTARFFQTAPDAGTEQTATGSK